MGEMPILVVIDACAEGAFEPVPGGPAPVIASLQAIPETTAFAAPVILCAERDMARARGALLVSGDTDGSVIALEPTGAHEDRMALLAAETVRLCPLTAGETFSEKGIELAPRAVGSIPLLPASLRGVRVPEPQAWQAICGARHG